MIMRTRVITFRMLVTLLVAVAAMSVNAQDSYREAVKEYLSATGVMENVKSLMPTFSMLFESDGQVDVEQLTKRYMDELFEDFLIEKSMARMKTLGLNEIDIREVASLLATPQGKIFQAHQKDWLVEFTTFMLMPVIEMGERYSKPEEERGPYKPFEIWPGFLDGETVQPKAEIDDAYAAKFNNVFMESNFVKMLLDEMKKSMSKHPSDTKYLDGESQKEILDRIVNALPTIMLNSAYGILTPEDIDYASILFSNDAYCKLQNNFNTGGSDNQMSDVGLDYVDWMKEQGAKLSENPEATLNFFKSFLNIGD